MTERAKSIGTRLVEFLGSFGMVCIILLLLMVLTFFGTLEQAHASLYEVQKKYFESLFVTVRPLPFLPLVLPGARLLLALLFVNLIVGGMLRLRRSWARLGVFIVHVGIAMLLLAGFVEFKASRKGHLTLFEGDRGAEFQSYFEWEVAVVETLDGGRVREYVIPHTRFDGLGPNESARFVADQLPFDVVLSGYLENCRPRRVPPNTGGVDGFVFDDLPGEMQAEANTAGISVSLAEGDGASQAGLLWGFQRMPWVVEVANRRFEVDLRKRSWGLPFEIHLRDFTRELHPGTGMASKFYSDVTCLEGNVSQDLTISMNEPLRRHGYTLYQASWGPGNARPGDRLFSTFAVVENPTDQVPKWACWVIAAGLLIHFVPRLLRHVRSQSVRTAS